MPPSVSATPVEGHLAVKKLINDPNQVAAETIEGLALAYPHLLRRLGNLQVVVRRDAPIKGKVGILTGGGSGHEPMFAGFVGRGMADASVSGHVFTSPPPPPIVEGAKAVQGGAGVLFLYGNYSGDVLNFDMAAEMLAREQIQVETVRVTDDVAAAPPQQRDQRRGIAGDLFVIKIAGARAEEGASLEEVVRAAQKANDRTRTMSVALSSCVIPASGRPIFTLGEDEMELGLGLHGEPGVERASLRRVNEIVSALLDRILGDLAPNKGDEVGVLVNGMGATPLSELLIVFRAVKQRLDSDGLSIARSYVGNFATSLDMAGCSLTLLRLDSDLKRWLLAACETPGLTQV